MFSGIENRKTCPTFTISVPMGLRSMGLRFTTGGELVTVGVKLGVRVSVVVVVAVVVVVDS